jgi:hypothetical protein
MATLPSVVHFRNTPEVRPLPSAGITRFQRYYGPVRHPARPDLALASLRLAPHRHRGGFPCCLPSRVRTCRRLYPGGILRPSSAQDRTRRAAASVRGWQPSSHASRVGSRIPIFEASMAFTVVTADSLAEPLRRPFASEASVASLPPRLLRLLPAGAPGPTLHRPPTFLATA